MTKKLFVVLVVISAMLISFSLVIARKAPQVEPVEPLKYEKKALPEKMQTMSVSRITVPAEKQQAVVLPGMKLGATVPVEGTATELIPMDKTDMCDMYGFPAYYWGEMVWGLEFWANFQDPYQFDYGCADVFPCSVIAIQFDVNVPAPVHMDIRPIVFENAGTDCPIPGDSICTGPTVGVDLTEAGWWYIPMELDPGCCMYEPYFAGVEILSDHSAAPLDLIAGNDGLVCQGYNDWQGFWEDCVADYGGPGMILLSSIVMTRPQNECVEEPVCCQFVDACAYLTPTACLDAGGVPAPDARYECIGDQCKLPWVVDTCTVELINPPAVRLLAGDAAQYEVTVAFEGEFPNCYLTTDPDPVCENCDASVFVPNPVPNTKATSTLTIQTAETTPVGVYTFEINGFSGAKTTATLEVVEPSDQCEMYRDNENWAYFWSGFEVGNMQCVFFDPATMCPSCGEDVYPFYLSAMKALFYDHQGAGYMEYILHVFSSTGDPCDGPGTEIVSWEVEVDQFMTWFNFSPPEKVCVNGPFFLAVEFNYDPGLYFPCLLWTDQNYMDLALCTQWMYYEDTWTAWEDFWTDPKGYMSLRAVGTCDADYCAPGVVCDMQYDNGSVASYWSGWGVGDKIALFYDPEEFCTEPVYPYHIADVELPVYNYLDPPATEVLIQVDVHLMCQDSCDGPGPEIYISDPCTVTTWYPEVAHIDLDEVVCVYEPFFISITWVDDPPNPSVMFDSQEGLVPDCFAWMYYYSAGYSPPWYEWSEFWSPPPPGYPMIRVSGFTADGDCAPPPCDTVIEQLAGGSTPPVYFWKFPQATFDLPNQRFEMPLDHGGRLESFQVALYERWDPGFWGDPNPDFYVWLSDGQLPLDNNPPYQAVADFHISYGEIAWYPAYNVVDAHSWGITFDEGEMFHIGVGHANEENDTLSVLGDLEGTHAGDIRGSNWNRTDEWEPLAEDYWLNIDAFICPFAPSGSTFTMKCKPSLEVVTPEDPPADLFSIEVKPVAGYPFDVSLVLLSIDPAPAQPITVVITPSSGTPEYTADVNITCPFGVAYDDYTLTFQGTGDPPDNQVKICDVTLRVQPPYDEVTVDFYHGFQRMTNYGAIANDAEDNFTYYGISALYDGSFISAVPAETPEEQRNHFALDMFDCEHLGFKPPNYIPAFPAIPWCPLSEWQEFFGYMAFTEFFTDEEVISCEWDSLFVIGLKNVECTDFAIKVKIYYNPTDTPIPELWIGLGEDWDVGEDNECWAGMDTLRNLMWMYEVVNPDTVFGTMKAPFYCDTVSQPPDDPWETHSHPLHSMVVMRNDTLIYPNAGFCDDAAGWYGLDSVWSLMTNHQYTGPDFWFTGDDSASDLSFLYSAPPFSLNKDEKHIEVWIDFGLGGVTDPDFSWSRWYHNVLRYVGFYRGDVNASDTLELPALDISDIVYLNNYLFKEGDPPLPFADQGNVDGKGPYGAFVGDNIDFVCPKENVDVSDLVYMINFVFKEGPPPVDYVRYIPSFYSRPSLFTDPVWK